MKILCMLGSLHVFLSSADFKKQQIHSECLTNLHPDQAGPLVGPDQGLNYFQMLSAVDK